MGLKVAWCVLVCFYGPPVTSHTSLERLAPDIFNQERKRMAAAMDIDEDAPGVSGERNSKKRFEVRKVCIIDERNIHLAFQALICIFHGLIGAWNVFSQLRKNDVISFFFFNVHCVVTTDDR